MPPSSSRLSPRGSLKRWPLLLLGGAIVLGAVVVGTLRARSRETRETVLSELAAARPARVFAPRLSIPTAYRPCAALRRAGETVPRDACGAASEPPAALESLDTLAATWESSDPDSLQASALIAMLGLDETEKSLDVAITRLSGALPLSSRRVPLLVDLSGAHLVRAQRTQNARDLLQALQYALEAVGSEPGNTAALFNAALAFEWLGLDEQGTLAWTAYLRADSISEWAAEARRRRQGLQHRPLPARAPGPESSEEEVRAFAMNHPQEARLLGWDIVLGRWGEAWEAGKTAEAADQLQLADRLGATLAWRNGDASLADAVGAIRAAADDPAATRVLARAHRRYAAAQSLYVEHDTRDAAKDSLARVLAARPPSPTLVRWAEAFQAATGVYDRKFSTAESAYQALLTRIDSVRYPALAARVRWMRGTGRIRADDYIQAREFYRSAARLFERAGETEFAAYARAQEGEAAYYQRDTTTAYPAMHRGLAALRGYRSSRWLHNTLFVLANAATADGMPLAAEKIRDEDVSVARRLPSSSVRVETLLGLVDIHAITARRRQAAENLDSAAAIVARMRDSKPRRNFEATVRSLRVLVATDNASIAQLDSAVDYFRKEKKSDSLIPALLRRADVRLAHGELSAAAADLDDATAGIQRLSRPQRDAHLRIAMMEQARSRFDQLVMLHVHAGDTVAALQTLERGRISFTPGSPRTASVPRSMAAPPGQVAVEYALIGDTLLTWTIRGNDVQLLRATVNRGDLLQTIERVDAALESLARAASAGPDLERLYELLVRPVKDRLGASETLVILADGEVAAVPFAALLDSRRNRYLIEDHTLRFAATLADAARPAPRTDGARPALLIADPAFDRARYPALKRLRGARAEVESLRIVYPANVVLDDSLATRSALTAHASRAGIIHYAGHAVFDDARPERSVLVLAGDTAGPLTAGAVNSLRLDGVRLVVLSACSTVRSREGRSGGFAGMSGALLSAGAGGVVGSLWQANDRLTQPLMLEFHRAYRQSGDPAAALREAQRRMLRSPDRPELRSPAAWAGFRYMGG